MYAEYWLTTLGDSRKISMPILWAASWNSKGERGFMDLNSEGDTFCNSKSMGSFSTEFPLGKIAETSVEIADLFQ